MPEREEGEPRPSPWRIAGPAAWVLAAAIPLAFLALFFLWPVLSLIATGFLENGRIDLPSLMRDSHLFMESHGVYLIGT